MDILARRRRKFFGVCTGKGLLGTPGGVGGWSGDLSGRDQNRAILSGWDFIGGEAAKADLNRY